MVLVETNIMTRWADNKLIEQFGRNDAEPFKWFRPVRALISATYYYTKYRSAEPIPGSEKADISEMVAAAAKDYGSTQFDAALVHHVEDLRRIVENLEARGCKIILFEAPYPSPLGVTHVATKTRALIQVSQPKASWLQIQARDLNFVDPFHLDDRSAASVAHEIERQINGSASLPPRSED
jgi:hypothetical protein